jgi:hypothetical protein
VRAVAGAFIASCIVLACPRLHAQETERCARDVAAVTKALDDDARRTRVWYWAWMATGSALLVGQSALAAFATGNTRVELVTGAATSVFIPGVLLAHPPRVLADDSLLHERLAMTTVGDTLGDPCIARSRALELLARDADDEALTTSWFAHTFVIGGNFVVGLFLGLAFHDWFGAVKQAVGGSLVGEVQILTLPGVALKARGLGIGGSF